MSLFSDELNKLPIEEFMFIITDHDNVI